MEKNKIEFLKVNFQPKYEKLLNGRNILECFSSIDGWLFYNSLTEAGILKHDKADKQRIWDEVRLDLSWFEPTKKNPKPSKTLTINETKRRLFVRWVIERAENLESFEDIINLNK